MIKPTSLFKNFAQVLFFITFFFTAVFADDSSPSTPQLTTASIIIGIILLIVGLVFTFSGKRILKFIIFLAGALLFAYLTFLSANAIIDLSTATDSQWIGIYCAMGILGLVGGLLATCVWQLGLMILGGAMGVSLGSMLIRTNIISSHTAQLVLLICFAVVFAILTFIFSNVFVIISTSIFGAFVFMSGVDCFAQKGFDNIISNIGKPGVTEPISGSVWAMLVSVLAIAIIGIIVQFRS